MVDVASQKEREHLTAGVSSVHINLSLSAVTVTAFSHGLTAGDSGGVAQLCRRRSVGSHRDEPPKVTPTLNGGHSHRGENFKKESPG